MFCEGKCKIKNDEGFEKRCPHFYTIIRQENMSGNKVEIEKCVVGHLLDYAERIELALIRIQAAVEDSRNEGASNEVRNGNIIATGFIGMMHAFNEDSEKFEKCLSLMQNTLSKGEQKIIDIQKHRIAKLKNIGE